MSRYVRGEDCVSDPEWRIGLDGSWIYTFTEGKEGWKEYCGIGLL